METTSPQSEKAAPAPAADASPAAHGARDQTLRLAGGAGISFTGKIVGRLVQVAAQIVFARYLGMHDFGRFALGMTLARILGTIAPLGLYRAGVVFGARYWKTDDARFRGVLVETLGLGVCSGIAFAAGLAFLSQWVSDLLHGGLDAATLRSFAWVIPGFAGLRIAADLTRISQRMQYGTLAEDFAQPAISLVVFVVLYASWASLEAAIFATVLAYTAACTLAVAFLFVLYPGELRATAAIRWNPGEIGRFAAPTALAIAAGVCTSMVDRLVVGRYRSPEEVALYQAASQVSVAFTIILGSFTTMFAPMAARFFAARDMAALQRLVWTSTKWGLYLGLPLFVFFAVAPEAVLGSTFGGSYADGATALRILAVGQLINVATGNVGVLMMTSGNQTGWMWLAIAAGVVNVAGCMLLVPHIGITGAALAHAAAAAVMMIGATIVIGVRLGIWPYEARTFRVWLIAAVTYAVGAAVAAAMPVAHPFLHMLAAGVAVLATFGVSMWFLGLADDERVLLEAVKSRMRSVRAAR